MEYGSAQNLRPELAQIIYEATRFFPENVGGWYYNRTINKEKEKTMELYSDDSHSYSFYVAGDGSYGDGSDIVIVDRRTMTDSEQHFIDELDQWHDWQRPQFVRWFLMNPHDILQGEFGCRVCEMYDPSNFHLTVEDILNELKEEYETLIDGKWTTVKDVNGVRIIVDGDN
jgi:hypothetical protein